MRAWTERGLFDLGPKWMRCRAPKGNLEIVPGERRGGRVMLRAGLVFSVVIVLAVVGAAWLGPGVLENSINRITPHDRWVLSPEAKSLHADLVVGDLHADSLLWDRDLLDRGDRGHVDVPRLLEGNVSIQVFPAVTKAPFGQNYESNSGDSDMITILTWIQGWPEVTRTRLKERALYQAHRLHDVEKRAPGRLRIVKTRGDLEAVLQARLRGEPLVGGLLATEGSHALDGELGAVVDLHEAGFRMMGLHHFFDNRLGGSLHGTGKGGLTPFGRDVVREMNQLGIMIDVAHSSPAVVEEVLEISEFPVVVSHTGIRSVCDTPRNLEDALVQRIADQGGLIGVGFWDGAVCDTTPAGVARAIVRAVELVGPRHVALGSDWDGGTEVQFDASELPALTQALLDQGVEEEIIRAVMGGNLVRYLGENLPVN